MLSVKILCREISFWEYILPVKMGKKLKRWRNPFYQNLSANSSRSTMSSFKTKEGRKKNFIFFFCKSGEENKRKGTNEKVKRVFLGKRASVSWVGVGSEKDEWHFHSESLIKSYRGVFCTESCTGSSNSHFLFLSYHFLNWNSIQKKKKKLLNIFNPTFENDFSRSLL